MGAFSPVPDVDAAITAEAQMMFKKALRGMQKRNLPYKGFLYAGTMITESGLKLIEFNVRFGDPEAQVVLTRLEKKCDLAMHMSKAREGRLHELPPLSMSPYAAVGVVSAAPGYPATPRKGDLITDAGPLPNTEVFYAGVRRDDDGKLWTDGGRILTAVGLAPSLSEARNLAYLRSDRLLFGDRVRRKDIALGV
jgi:phosphoribosylamine--glycine ligase